MAYKIQIMQSNATIIRSCRVADRSSIGSSHSSSTWRGLLHEKVSTVCLAVFGCLGLYIALSLCYKHYLVKYYEYYGFSFEAPCEGAVLLHLALIVFFSLQLVRLFSEVTVTNITLVLMVILNLIPATVMFTYKPALHEFFYYCYWVTLIVLSRVIVPLHRGRGYSETVSVFKAASIIIFLVLLYSWGAYAHFNIQLDVLDVYGTRLESRSYAIPTVLLYAISTSNILIPLLIVWAWQNKQWFYLTLQCLSALIYFWMYAVKLFLLLILLACVICFLYKRQLHLRYYPLAFMLLVLIGLAAAQIMGRSMLIDLLIRRGMFVPVRLDYAYFDFFTNHAPDYFRSSILRYFGYKSAYSGQAGIADLSFLIGLEYFGSISMRANNGLFSDAFANLGIAGTFFMPLLITALLKAFDTASEGHDEHLVLLLSIAISSALISSSFFTNLVTHGLLFLLVFVYLLPRNSL